MAAYYDTKTGKRTAEGIKAGKAKGIAEGGSLSELQRQASGGGGGGDNKVKYDWRTGRLLGEGESTTDLYGNTFKQGQEWSPTKFSNIINAPEVLSPYNIKAKFPTMEETQYPIISPIEQLSPIEQQRLELEKQQQKTQEDYVTNLLNDYEDRVTGADIDAKLQKQLGIKQKQEAVNALTTQLNTIVNQGQANQLSVVGQGRGIPEAIIGGQQAQFARETAIQALPVQAQLSAAQGNLEMANQSLDRLFKIYSDDARNEYEFRREVRKTFYDFATANEKRQMDRLDLLETRAYNEKQSDKKSSEDMIKNAFSQGAPMSVTNKALEIYENGGDQMQVAKSLGLYAGDYLGRQIKLAQLAEAKTKATGTVSPASQGVVDVARELLNNPDLGAITGTIQQVTGGFLGDKAKLAKNKWKQLKGMLSLENRQLLKGSGAISDFEFRVLGEASSSLGRNLSDATFRDELNKLISRLSGGEGLNKTSSGNIYTLTTQNGQINNNQGVTPSGINFTIIP